MKTKNSKSHLSLTYPHSLFPIITETLSTPPSPAELLKMKKHQLTNLHEFSLAAIDQRV